MDFNRFFLYSSLAAVTYLLLLAWQDDYPPLVGDAGIVRTEAPQIPTDGDVPTSTTDIPTEVPTRASTTTANVSTPQVVAENSGPRIVSVKTDTFDLEIDLNGGDIVYLALPKYLKQIDIPDDPFVILENSPGRDYVAQSGLIGRNGIDSAGRASYQSTQTSFELSESAARLDVDLTTTDPSGVRITKRYSFSRDSYLIDISFIVDNQSSETWEANAFGQIKRDSFDDPSNAGGLGRTYLGFVGTSVDDPQIEAEFDDIDDGTLPVEMEGGWISFSQHYFLTAWIPNIESSNRFVTRKNQNNQYFGEFTSSAFSVEAGATANHDIQFYAGPKDQYVIAEISPNLDLTIDYSFLWFLAAPIYWLLTRINSIVGNYGLSIILLTVCVKAAFYKLSETQYRSMAGMRRLMPKMQQLKESYGDDKMKMQKATMDLYKKEKINPFGGCLPMLVQMPVFIALYWVLLESVELRHAPFIFWLNDLSVRDPFFILPLMMGATMYLQTTLSPAPADPMQAKVMKLMPVMMTVLFLWFPAGLVLYWFTNGALGILQQWYITRKIEAAYEAKNAS